MWKSAGCAPSLRVLPGICLTTEEKARKNLSQVKKNLSQSTVYILPIHIHITKTLTNTHITKLTHTHTYAHTYSLILISLMIVQCESKHVRDM
jgi:hypothetical protein